MIAAFWGTVAGVLVLAALAVCDLIDAPEPAGAHHKPRAPREWPWRERVAYRAQRRIRARQDERTADDAYLRDLEEIHAGQHMAAYAGPRLSGPLMPLMPLPPEVDWHDDCPTCPACGSHRHGGVCAGPDDDDPWMPEDPADVVTPDDEADAYVGDLGPAELEETSQPPGSESSGTLEETSKPEFGHLREGQYAEATGQFSRAVLDTYERAQVGVK